ncbi:ligase-associated DNA damage response endonuclease PdeM [Belliella aquatica]|uniref:DEAD/DEAH box helicase n=1 Tax=Belliella aquatica TaxID=1323734 RepID=A0ABQ1MFP5_9BACT|nr:ligase-associated DNA damage response endonuclease PdeM [Belliella aquatica]MCH7405076.1 ligase-associated DNA damage response endonuclease PdeM [Belliella aquatica]GGC39975.1 DEAD/DEAH box helicase [Belliella aquatica]
MQENSVGFELILKELSCSFWLLPQKAIYIKKHQALLIADPHFGKAGHFRKAGIPISEHLHDDDLQKISQLIQQFESNDIYFLGDLFHSDLNESWWVLETFIDSFPKVNFHLVKGNHDILPQACYTSGKWIIHEEPLEIENFLLSHEPLPEVPEGKINFCGHIHPGIALRGKGRQKITLPCFFYSQRRIILPAFGRFTGLDVLACTKLDQAFVIADEVVIQIN